MWHGERGAGSCGSVSSVGCGSVSGCCGVSVGAHGVHHVRVHGVVGVHGGIAEGVGVLLLRVVERRGVGIQSAAYKHFKGSIQLSGIASGKRHNM